MSIQSSSVPTVNLPSITLKNLLDKNKELKAESETHKQQSSIKDVALETLKNENTELKNDNIKLKNEKIENETLIQFIDDDLQSSKRVLQCVCAIAGAILGGGLVLAFPPVGATIALVGTGSMATGAAIASGCLVAPVVHKKTHKALIQQVQNFKAKKEDSKKAE